MLYKYIVMYTAKLNFVAVRTIIMFNIELEYIVEYRNARRRKNCTETDF